MKRNLVVTIAKLRDTIERIVHSENKIARTLKRRAPTVVENPVWVENYSSAVRTACLRGTAPASLTRSLPGINYIVKV